MKLLGIVMLMIYRVFIIGCVILIFESVTGMKTTLIFDIGMMAVAAFSTLSNYDE